MKRTYSYEIEGQQKSFTSSSKRAYTHILLKRGTEDNGWPLGWTEGGRHTSLALAEKKQEWFLQGVKPQDLAIIELEQAN